LFRFDGFNGRSFLDRRLRAVLRGPCRLLGLELPLGFMPVIERIARAALALPDLVSPRPNFLFPISHGSSPRFTSPYREGGPRLNPWAGSRSRPHEILGGNHLPPHPIGATGLPGSRCAFLLPPSALRTIPGDAVEIIVGMADSVGPESASASATLFTLAVAA
jgi:hypothetical protein